jgi:1,4-alpha-glucan branching enzyme
VTKHGAFAFMLHSHLPYVRKAGVWPHGEEMVHEAMCDTYVPLLDALYDLADEGCPFHIAIGITPILSEQLSDPTIVENFRTYMGAMLARIEEAVVAYARRGERELSTLARWYVGWNQAILDHFNGRYEGNVVQAFRKLQDAGHVEIVGSAATHGFLPLMARESTIVGQIGTGIQTHERHFGRKPQSFWLPECGYRPAYYDVSAGQAAFRPGLEAHLERFGVRAFFADAGAIEGGNVSDAEFRTGYAASSFRAAQGTAQKRNLQYKSTAWPYLVSDSDVAVFGRDTLTSRQVWSANEGYPGHSAYREFHKKDAICGMRFWRITGPRVDLGSKGYYNPKAAFNDIGSHVEHFIGLVERHIAGNAMGAMVPPMILSPYDTELFGHWWFEGVEWLKQVLRRLSTHPKIDLTTPAAYLQRYPPTEKIALPESSWGAGGDARTWYNDDTKWMWPIIHQYERQMEDVVAQHPEASGEEARTLAQVARELVLLESSDWPFLISTGQAGEYASERFRSHAARFDRLVDELFAGRDSAQDATTFHKLDNPFPDIDYRAFAGVGSSQ